MNKKKPTILLSVSPEEKEAIQIAAASERRSVANFIKSIILDNQKVKEVLEQGNCNPIEKDEHEVKEIAKAKEALEQKQVKSNEVPQVEKKQNSQTEQKEIDMRSLTHDFKF